MEIRDYAPAYAVEIAKLFHCAVHAIDTQIYSPEQQEAWAPTPPDFKAWARRLEQKRPWLALVEGCVAGFIELDADGHIDCLYVHPDFQRREVAATLYTRLEMQAKERGLKRLYVEASLLARPFFEKRGFLWLESSRSQRSGVELVTHKLEKIIRFDC